MELRSTHAAYFSEPKKVQVNSMEVESSDHRLIEMKWLIGKNESEVLKNVYDPHKYTKSDRALDACSLK